MRLGSGDLAGRVDFLLFRSQHERPRHGKGKHDGRMWANTWDEKERVRDSLAVINRSIDQSIDQSVTASGGANLGAAG